MDTIAGVELYSTCNLSGNSLPLTLVVFITCSCNISFTAELNKLWSQTFSSAPLSRTFQLTLLLQVSVIMISFWLIYILSNKVFEPCMVRSVSSLSSSPVRALVCSGKYTDTVIISPSAVLISITNTHISTRTFMVPFITSLTLFFSPWWSILHTSYPLMCSTSFNLFPFSCVSLCFRRVRDVVLFFMTASFISSVKN